MVFRWILRKWIHLALWFRYRQIQIVHHAPVDTDVGAVIAGNHQNALLDSLTLAACSPKVPFTLSRGSLFETPIVRGVLGAMRMQPIYRFRDGFRKMRQNPEAFSQFVEVLRKNEWLLIFPEGSHLLGYKLRPLQRGLARIVFAAQEAQEWQKEIPIIPVGLQYESHTVLGSRLLIQYGPPLSSLAFHSRYLENPKAAERALTAELFEEIKRLIVVLPSDDEAYERALQLWNQKRTRFPNLMDQFRADRSLVSNLDEGSEAGEEEGHPALPAKSSSLRKLAGYILSLPGLILHAPVLLLILTVERVFIEDEHLAPSVRFAEGLLLAPLWYLLAGSSDLAWAFRVPHSGLGTPCSDDGLLVALEPLLALDSNGPLNPMRFLGYLSGPESSQRNQPPSAGAAREMASSEVGKRASRRLLLLSISTVLISSFLASQVQSSGGKVQVRDIKIPTQNGQWLVADLFKPKSATSDDPAPFVVVVPGFQRSKEALANISLELARRGIVVASIDPYAQGRSSASTSTRAATTEGYGMFAVVDYAASSSNLNYIDKSRIGATGHSAGGNAAIRGANFFGKEAQETGRPNKLHSVFVSGYVLTLTDEVLQDVTSNVGMSYA